MRCGFRVVVTEIVVTGLWLWLRLRLWLWLWLWL